MNDAADGCVRRAAFADAAAIAQHGEAVRDVADFFQKMGNVQNRVTVGLELSNEIKQMADIGGGEAACRFVQHQHATPHRDGTADLHQLPIGGTEPGDNRLRADIRPTKLP